MILIFLVSALRALSKRHYKWGLIHFQLTPMYIQCKFGVSPPKLVKLHYGKWEPYKCHSIWVEICHEKGIFFQYFKVYNVLFIEQTQMPNSYKCQHLFCSPWCSIYPLEANGLLLRGLPNCEKRRRNLWNYIHETKCKKCGRSASLVLICGCNASWTIHKSKQSEPVKGSELMTSRR